jgi:hypothetical protein
MNPDTLSFVLLVGICAGVVLYIAWSNRHYRDQQELKDHQQHLLREIQGELDRNEAAIQKRHWELQRKLDDHGLMLKALSHSKQS